MPGKSSSRIWSSICASGRAPIANISVNVFHWAGLAEVYSTQASSRPGRWRDALTLIENETRRPLTGGFTLPEVDRVVTTSLKAARNVSLRSSSRTSDELASGIAGTYAERLTFILPERDFQRISAVPSPDDFDAKNAAPREALAAILNNRLFNEQRQAAGATYSPQRLDGASQFTRGFGFTGAIVEVAVADVPLAKRSLRTIAASLAELGPTDEEFTRVLAPLRARVTLNARLNGWWLGALDRVQTPPDSLDRVRLHTTALNDLTRDQVKALAAQVFTAPAITIRVLPKP